MKEKDQWRATWIEPKYSTDETVTPLALQREDPKSYFNHYKDLIALRNSHPALAIGEMILPEQEFPKSVMAYFRKSGDQEIFVIHNIGSNEVDVELPEGYKEVIFGLGDGINVNGNLNLKGFASRVYLKNI